MISLAHYVGPHFKSPDWTTQRQDNALALLSAVAKFQTMLEEAGVVFRINPATGTQVSGKTFGGFRPKSCPQGAPTSSHKEGRGVDLYDPKNELDDWITKSPAVLEECGLYREDPSATDGWLHLTTRAPHSGKRTFMP